MIYSFINELWVFLNQISPYLIFGFIIAGILSVMISQEFIESHLGKQSGILSVFKAAILGIPLPLCSCSVIPVSASLKKHGASKASISSFLLSTPQTGVDSIMVTYGLLGPIVAIIRPIIALITGLVGGIAVHLIDNVYDENSPVEECKEHCCKHHQQSTLKKILTYSFVTLPKDIAKPLVYGIIIASLINLFLPDELFSNYLGDGILPMIFMIIIGTPLYVCATASIPIALAMISKGATIGAALVFLMVGPATNTTSITTMLKILGKRSTLITLSVLIITSLLFGLLIDNLNLTYDVFKNYIPHHHHEHISLFHNICSIFFLGILINTLIVPKFSKK
mgnify:CR=1 FL=1